MLEVLERARVTQACNRNSPPTSDNKGQQSVTPSTTPQAAATKIQRHWRRTTRGTGTNSEGGRDKVLPGSSPSATPRVSGWTERSAASVEDTQTERQDLAPPPIPKDTPPDGYATRKTHATTKSRTTAERTSTTTNCCLPWKALCAHIKHAARRSSRSITQRAHRMPSTVGYRATRVGEANNPGPARTGDHPHTYPDLDREILGDADMETQREEGEKDPTTQPDRSRSPPRSTDVRSKRGNGEKDMHKDDDPDHDEANIGDAQKEKGPEERKVKAEPKSMATTSSTATARPRSKVRE